MISEEDKLKIDSWVAKFPTPKGAVLMALRILQDRHGWLSDEALQSVAQYLNIPPVDVYEVVSFYSMYRRQKGGKHFLKVCTSLSCCLTGAHDVVKYIENKAETKLGGFNQEANITLEETECLGACQYAPVVLVNDQDYHHDVTPEKLDVLLSALSEEVV